jgi:hypothetical protein
MEKKMLFIMIIMLMFGKIITAANIQFTKASILEIRTYNEPGYEGDIAITVFVNGVNNYFYMLGVDNSTVFNYAHLMQAVKNNWTINMVYDPTSTWAGSSNPFRKVLSIGITPS